MKIHIFFDHTEPADTETSASLDDQLCDTIEKDTHKQYNNIIGEEY